MRKILILATLALGTGVPALVAQKAPAPKSKGEAEALQAVFSAVDADTRIKAADALLSKYADTDFKGLVLYLAAVSYSQKNDYEKMIIYAERAVEADPKQYPAMLMLAKGIAQRTREFDLDREEKLARAEKYAKNAMEILKDAPKPNQTLTDEQWAQGKKEYMAQGHEALGYAAMARKNFDVAISEMKLALDEAPDPVTMVRLAAVYDQTGKPDDAIALLDKVMAMSDVHPSIKQFAQAERVRALQLKSGGAKPAAPAANGSTPPPADTKKQ
ncbi:MAG TPA: tetratricopeptide repeat protein [Bryobacteraceae bacterium]|nr:tetratricopeptide repeat protein [Bryobacteraceae bacterium]